MDADQLRRARDEAFRACKAAGASHEDAEDAAQDAITDLLALRAIQATETINRPMAWVRTVSRHRLIDLLRTRRSNHTALNRAAERRHSDIDPAEVVADRDHAQWLAQSLTELPPTTQHVCAAVAHGKTPHEIATELKIPIRSVESHLTRARRILRKLGTLAALTFGWTTAKTTKCLYLAASCAAQAAPAVALLVAVIPPSTPTTTPDAESLSANTATPPPSGPDPITIDSTANLRITLPPTSTEKTASPLSSIDDSPTQDNPTTQDDPTAQDHSPTQDHSATQNDSALPQDEQLGKPTNIVISSALEGEMQDHLG